MAARAVDRGAGTPLWAQVQDDMLRRIRGGEFAAAFPGELDLVEQYGVSRHTVRQALAQLRADGLVVAERGRPPRLAPVAPRRDIEQPLGSVYSLFGAVEALGYAQTSEVRRLERTADGTVAARLGLEESTPLLYLERLRLADGEPLAWDRVWLPFAEAEPLIGVDLSHTALYRELATRTPLRIDGGRERIHAVNAVPAVARLLGVEPGAALFGIERLGCSAERPVEWRHTLVRGDRFALSVAAGPGAGWAYSADDSRSAPAAR